MVALLTLLSVVTISILINRVASKALMMTGLSRDVARFQARSVTTGIGFTTDEAEYVTRHPVRRRIAFMLMLVQSAGLVTVISLFILSFVDAGTTAETLRRGLLLIGGLAVLGYLTRSEGVNRYLERVIGRALRRYTDLRVRDYESLLQVREGYKVIRLRVEEESWLANRTLEELGLPEEGVTVLSITRADDSTASIPRGSYRIHPRDTLVLYGREEGIEELGARTRGPAGAEARRRAEDEHADRLRRQDTRQDAYEATRRRGGGRRTGGEADEGAE